ncbi:MAG TPA: DnaJ domain-containing protein [Anaerolineales bacterium]|nr:DnaJ domain-containing protein [Anaerolineales bacterium]
MSIPADNHYARLGVHRDASPEEVRSAYHEAAKRLHPDVNPDPAAMDVFLAIQESYEVLSSPDRRQDYDSSLPETGAAPPLVKVGVTFSRSSLARIGEPQLIYAMIELGAKPTEELAGRPPMNLCLVLDRSTSMQGLRLDTLKSTARELIRQLHYQDYLSIVVFSDNAEVILPASRGIDLPKVEARISMVQSSGGTEIFKGLNAGFFEIQRYAGPAYINHLILITDGRTYGDEEDSLSLAVKARDKGITISGLGIGTEWNDSFMDELTGLTGGNSQFIASAEDLQAFLADKFSGLGKIFAERLSINFIQDPNVELKYLFRLDPDPGPLPLLRPLVVGNLPRDSTMTLLMEFLVSSVPEDAGLVNLVRGDLKLDIPLQMIPTTKIPLALTMPTSENIDPEPPPDKIVRALSRLTLYRMQEQARAEIAAGNFEQATRRLQNLATHLLSQGEKGLARTVLAEADRLEKEHSFSEQGEKRIKYGTRALLLPTFLEDNPG